jgi:hypothetical protein
MPVDGGTDAQVVRCDFLLWSLVVAEVPALYGSIVSTESKLYSVSRRPLNIAYASVDASVLIATAADGDVSAHVSQVPQTNGGIVACRQQQVALMRVESKLVYLTRMFMQSGKLYAGMVQVVQYDFAIGSGSCNMRAELAMRPLYVVDAQAFALSDMGVGIVENSSAQVGLVDDLGILHTDCF